MKTLGIIAEYNPFHYGHKYHIETAKTKSGADVVVAIMSGDFTQRGEPAVNDKWTRASWALNNGVDLVLELPTIYATSNAGDFALGGVSILESLGIDYISFGAEAVEDELLRVKDALVNNREEIQAKISSLIKKGYSYPVARTKVVNEITGFDYTSCLKEPNNILAVEYLMNMKSSQPLIIQRKGTGYNETEIEGLPSASAIRSLSKEGRDFASYVPKDVGEIIDVNKNNVWEMAVLKALQMTPEEIDNIYSADIGFGNLIKKQLRSSHDYDSLVELLKSKRYTQTRINRFLIQLVLNITKDDFETKPSYVRVLGFNKIGSDFLKKVKGKETSIITNVNKRSDMDEKILHSLSIDIKANDIYNLIAGRDLYDNSDYVKMPVIIQK